MAGKGRDLLDGLPGVFASSKSGLDLRPLLPGELVLTSGGHPPAIHHSAADGTIELLELEAYPAGPEAESVRSQMETLRSNARIEEARELRDRILEMINRRRFSEALELARDLVGRFPDTAAAAELTRQMARLEELADAERTGR